MASKDYWKRRAEERMARYHKSTDKTMYDISKIYDKSIKSIDEDIKAIFDKYHKDSGLTQIEARRYLNSSISSEMKKELLKELETVTDAELRRKILNRLNAPAYAARMTRLEAVKESIYRECVKRYEAELKATTKLYANTIKDAYYRNIFDIQKGLNLGFDFALLDNQRVESILNTNWSGKHFSERIWGNNVDVMAAKLSDIIIQGALTGKGIQKMSQELYEFSEVGKHAANRLVRTETTYMANQAELESYKELDIEKYEFLATLDLRTSRVCRSMDGKIIEVKEGEAGSNLPPLHPHCRSTTVAHFDKVVTEGLERRARDPETGKNRTIPANMKYEDWYQKHVVEKYGEEKAQVMDKMVTNKAQDKKQYERYRGVLGKEIGVKSFEEFQNLKYTDSVGWKNTKTKYSVRNSIRSGEYPLHINQMAQNKHIVGTNQYTEGRSILSIPIDQVQELVTKYAGTGELIVIDGEWKKKERIKANSKIVGVFKDNGMEIGETSNFMIHYNFSDKKQKRGTHIVPSRPN